MQIAGAQCFSSRHLRFIANATMTSQWDFFFRIYQRSVPPSNEFPQCFDVTALFIPTDYVFRNISAKRNISMEYVYHWKL